MATYAAEGFTQEMKREPAIHTTVSRLINLRKVFERQQHLTFDLTS